MAIKYPPSIGTIILCDFRGTVHPEIAKKRPVVVLATPSYRLAIVVPLSTTQPSTIKPWHYQITTADPLPAPYDSECHWAKCDLACAVSFERLILPSKGKDANNKRVYDVKKVSDVDLMAIRAGVVAAISACRD